MLLFEENFQSFIGSGKKQNIFTIRTKIEISGMKEKSRMFEVITTLHVFNFEQILVFSKLIFEDNIILKRVFF